MNNEPALKYESKNGLMISESTQHNNGNGTMFIVESIVRVNGEDRTRFHTITSTKELIKIIHPPKKRIHSPQLSSRAV